jgi:hypothetical protein
MELDKILYKFIPYFLSVLQIVEKLALALPAFAVTAFFPIFSAAKGTTPFINPFAYDRLLITLMLQ